MGGTSPEGSRERGSCCISCVFAGGWNWTKFGTLIFWMGLCACITRCFSLRSVVSVISYFLLIVIILVLFACVLFVLGFVVLVVGI